MMVIMPFADATAFGGTLAAALLCIRATTDLVALLYGGIAVAALIVGLAT